MAKKAETEKPQAVEKAPMSRGLGTLEDMERWMEQSLPRGWLQRFGWPSWGELTRPMERLAPRVDVIDRDDEVLLRAEVPGVNKDDLEISVTDGTVTIKGTTRQEEKEEKGDYYRCEIASGAFSRTISLPSTVDPDKGKASFADGVLELKIPKVAKAKRRRINVD